MVYPQWQGGDIARWINEVPDPAEASRGYALGATMLDFLVPTQQGVRSVTVPIDMRANNRQVQDGVKDRDVIARQTKAALDILDVEQPERIAVLGGECSVSVAPFTWLARKYGPENVAMLWIDAHPDITLPGDP